MYTMRSPGPLSEVARSRTSADQTWNIGKPADWHINWGFTEQGLYTLHFKGHITGPNGTLTSRSHEYHFCVIPDQGAPAASLERICGL